MAADYPLDVLSRQTQSPLHRGQRDVDDRDVQDEHELRRAKHREYQIGAMTCDVTPALWLAGSGKTTLSMGSGLNSRHSAAIPIQPHIKHLIGNHVTLLGATLALFALFTVAGPGKFAITGSFFNLR